MQNCDVQKWEPDVSKSAHCSMFEGRCVELQTWASTGKVFLDICTEPMEKFIETTSQMPHTVPLSLILRSTRFAESRLLGAAVGFMTYETWLASNIRITRRDNCLEL